MQLGIPPRVVNPFKVPEITPVIIFAGSLFIFLLGVTLSSTVLREKIIIKHTYK
jgi:hypothetical protein